MTHLKSCTKSQVLLSRDASFRYAYFPSIDAAGTDWDAVAPPHNIFLQRDYLRVLENYPPDDMRFAYLVFYKNEQPIGISYCQIKNFRADTNIRDEKESAKNPCFFTGLAKGFRKWVATKMSADILISGNMLLSGEHGFRFLPDTLSDAEQIAILDEAWKDLIKIKEKEGVKMPVILVKDISEYHKEQSKLVQQQAFVQFEIQPCMAMPLPFESFDAYLQSMSTKYRTRAKRAFKKAQGIEKREMTLADIQRELPRIYDLYLDIAENAGFNMVDLNRDYLPGLKAGLGNKFRMFAYYEGDSLLAFYTIIENNHELEAHFLGYDKEQNHDKQLYLNILYDIVRHGIELKSEVLVLARTALEIKSSIGALPTQYYCYLRHQNNITNKLTGHVLEYMKPVEDWQPRHPFKEPVELSKELLIETK
jgi:hypothetical protein